MIRLCQLRPLGRGQETVVFREMQMKHASQADFGRPMQAVQEHTETNPDKWQLLQLLTEAAEDFSLSHRTLGVLKALLTFLPTRAIPDGPGAVVFPANRTLSHRLSGMPESTLRRHLAALVKAGVVSRQDSPNGKRYARMRRGQVALAYGFDLSLLAQMGARLDERAKAARETRDALMILRSQVMTLRAELIVQSGEGSLSDTAGLILRRKPNAESLQEMKDRLTNALAARPELLNETPKVSGDDDQNERHIQCVSNIKTKPLSINPTSTLDVRTVSKAFSAFKEYFPEKITSWFQLIRIAEQIAPMVGICSEAMNNARLTLGKEQTAVAIFSILERFAKIRCPNAFLGHLTVVVKEGRLRMQDLLGKQWSEIVS